MSARGLPSWDRVAAIAGNTFQEAIRMRLFLLLGLVAVGSLAGGFVFREFNLGVSELRFIADFGFGGMTLFGSVVAIVVTAQLLFGEIERGTIRTLLAKPVGRADFVLGKLIGAWLTICCFIAVLCVTLLIALWARETQLMASAPADFPEGRVVSYENVALFAVLQTFRLAILSAATAFFASYASSTLFAIFMGFFFWIIAQLQSTGAGGFGDAGNWLVEGISRAVSLIVPDLRLFDLGNQILEASSIGISDALRLALYAIAYLILYVGLATWILLRREL